MYALHLQGQDGGQIWKYDQIKNTLYDAQNNRYQYPKPRPEKQDIILRILLSFDCDYGCKYCMPCQKVSRDMTAEDIRAFFKAVPFENYPVNVNRIQYHGGEPLQHFSVMQEIHPILKELFPELPHWRVSTNGAYLTPEIGQWLVDNNVKLILSWDGPGQHIRGANPLDDPAILGVVRDMQAAGCLANVRPTMHASNQSVSEFIACAAQYLDVSDLDFGFFQPAMITTEQAWEVRMPEENVPAYVRELFRLAITGNRANFRALYSRAMLFLAELNQGLSGVTIRHKMSDDPVYIADLSFGDVSHIFRLPPDRSSELFYTEQRMMAKYLINCSSCPARHLCRGACLPAPQPYAFYNCRTRSLYWTVVLGIALFLASGMILTRIQEV